MKFLNWFFTAFIVVFSAMSGSQAGPLVSSGGYPACHGAIVNCGTAPEPNLYGTSLCILPPGEVLISSNDLQSYEHDKNFSNVQKVAPTIPGATVAYETDGFSLQINTNQPSWLAQSPARLSVPALGLNNISLNCTFNQ
jgi:hypothetical protein